MPGASLRERKEMDGFCHEAALSSVRSVRKHIRNTCRGKGEEQRETNLHTERGLEKHADAEAEKVEQVVFSYEVGFGGGHVIGEDVVKAARPSR